MVIPSASKVEPRFHKTALFAVVACNVFILCVFGGQAYTIYATRAEPPTQSMSVDGARLVNGANTWGRMPYIILASRSKHPIVGPTDITLHDTEFSNMVFTELEPKAPNSLWYKSENTIVVNLTTLIPKFDVVDTANDFPAVMIPNFFIANMQLKRGVLTDIYTAPPDTPPEALRAPWPNIEKYVVQQGFMNSMYYNEFDLSQTIVPKKGICWGLPLTAPCTKARYNMVSTRRNRHGGRFTGLTVFMHNRMIDIVQPLSLVAQFGYLLSSFGGILALCNTVFYFFFVPRWPKTDAQKHAEELTLRGFQEKSDRGQLKEELLSP